MNHWCQPKSSIFIRKAPGLGQISHSRTKNKLAHWENMLLPTFLQKHPFRKKCTEFSSCNEHIRNTQNFYSFLHNLWLIYLKCWNTIRFLNCYKGIVHPKIQICHTHPWVVPNLFEFLSSVDMLKDVGNQTVNSTHCLPNFFSYHGSQWLPSAVWLPTIFNISKEERHSENPYKLIELNWFE